MAVFEWDERYNTGISSIDQQHQELFKAMGRLSDAFKRGHGHQQVAQVLEFLARYTKEHFDAEEAYMKRIAFPELQAHLQEHRILSQKVLDLQNRYLFDDPSVGMTTSQLLYEWLRNHILQKDFAYITHARETHQL